MVAIFLGMLSSLGLAVMGIECHEGAGWLSGRIVRAAVKRLPAHVRGIREEEWLAELDAFEGLRILKLSWSIGVYLAAVRINFRYRSKDSRLFALPSLSAPPGTILATRQHPAVLIPRMLIGWAWISIALAATVNVIFLRASAWELFTWLPCLLVFPWTIHQIWKWAEKAWFLKDEQFILRLSVNGRSLSPFSRTQITNVRMERSLTARLLGYWTLVIEGSDESYYLHYMPFPNEMFELFQLWLSCGPESFQT